MGKIRWLHISDLHYDREMMGDWPVRQEDFPDKDIDFIVFTGDLHTYGRDYNEGKRFLAGLAERYHLNPNEDVFIVPGNHDVDPYRSLTEEIDAVKSEKGRKDAERKAKKAAKAASKSFEDFAIERLKHLRNAPSDALNADGSHLSHRFSEYCEAVESICGPATFLRDRDPFAYADTFCRKWKDKINLIHVNSALLSCSNTYLAQILDICALNDLGHDDTFDRTLPTMVLAHHNYAELAFTQRKALKPILADLNVRAYMREEYKLTEVDRNASFIFLLDGFNEIPTTTMQIRCLRDILDISDKKYPEAAIILSNRDPLDTYMDLLEYENGFDADQIDRLKFYFHNCYIKELSQEQIDDYIEPNQRCLIPAARNILDTPFYLVLYRQAMQPSGKDAGRWITDAFRDHLNNGTPEKTTLMLQMLLREINNLRSDITSAERELRGFILTKVLPYLGYQMALSSRLDPALTPIKSPNFFRRDAYARTYACLSAYLPTIDIWNEYKNQNPETLEKPWNTLRKLYQDSNPDISDLTAAIPYTVFPSGLLCHHGRNISFCHDNYRDFFAAFHIANVVYGLCNGINLAALSPDAQEVFLLQLETLDNSILFDAISILRQYFGLSIYDISAQDTTDLSDTCAQIALPAILIRLLDAVIRRGELSKNEHSQLCQLRSTLCERFVLSFKALNESDPLQTKYCLFFSLALSMLARDYRTGIAGTRDLIKCAGYAQQCINGEKKLNIPKADGYLQVALCLNARMEDMLNVTDTKMNGTLPFSSQLADAVREAVRDYHEGSMYKRDEAVRTFRRNLFPRWKPSLGNVLACCDIFQIILEAAYEKYVSAANQNNQNYQEIARLGYVSKAYLVLAAIGTSGGALNLLAQMLINQANQYEADQRIPFFRRHPDIGTFVQQHAAPYGWPLNDNYALAYRVLQIVCGIQRGSQPYSHMKKAELVLKGYVSESSSTQLTSLNIAINGGLAMGHYWKGRLLLEQAKQDHDRCNDYKDAAIASFCATNVTERFDHLPENADEDAAPQLSPPQWLSAIELLRYPDREVFRVDRRMVFQTIYQKLTQQVEEVQSDRIQIHNERYRLTKKDVRSNMERCLDMVKVQFPDKEPLIQEMIRSIR